MGLFDKFKKKSEADASEKTEAMPERNALPEIQFYNECVEDFHKTAMGKGQATRGLIFIPELIPIGEKTVLAFLKDPFFQMEFGENPQLYYYVIMSLSLQAGIVFAFEWHADYDALKSGYVDQIIEEGPAEDCKPFLKALGLTTNEEENAFYHTIFDRWLAKHEPYWKMDDPREYTFRATLAAYQLGISMILCEYGY